MKRLALLLGTMAFVGLCTYAVMIFTGNTPKVSESVEMEVSGMFENPHSNTMLLKAMKTASLIAQKPEKMASLKELFSDLSYYMACIQILELEDDAQKIRGLVLNLMMKQKALSAGYMSALDNYRQINRNVFRKDTERPDMAFAHCKLELTPSEKTVYLQRWKDHALTIKNN